MKLSDNTVLGLRKYVHDQLISIYTSDEIKTLEKELFAYLYNWDSAFLVLNPTQRLSESEILKTVFAVDDLKQHKPIQYVTAKTEFFFREFEVNEHVLIPRPETEELCEWIISEHKNTVKTAIDIGTGSGCIPVTLSAEIPSLTMWANDVSSEAIQVAKKNAANHKVTIRWESGDVLSNSFLLPNNEFDLVVSNPPYVLKSDQIFMEKNVVEYEPHIALFVENNDPLLFYREIAQKSLTWLKSGGWLYFEIHEKLGKEVEDLMKGLGYLDVLCKQDMFGKDRMVRAKKL
jgi:release factor glutamine methyltransferase